jgi:hypothetical protein
VRNAAAATSDAAPALTTVRRVVVIVIPLSRMWPRSVLAVDGRPAVDSDHPSRPI